MTKKHYSIIGSLLTLILIVPFYLYLPIQVGGQRPGNVPMLVLYAGFLAFTASVLIVFALIFINKPDYIKQQLATLTRFKYLLALMVKRDFVTRYRRSVLGILWSILNPLFTMIILSMVFSFMFRIEVPNFPLFVLSGQLIFNFFSESTNNAMLSVVGNGPIIKKIYVPKYVFPISRVVSSLVNVGFSLIAFVIVFIFTQQEFTWTVLLVPIPIIYTFLFAMGVGMFLSSLMVFFRDIGHIYGVLITLWMFLSAIMYPPEILPPRVFHLIHFNPMFQYIGYFRDLTLHGVVPGLWTNIICIGFALAALCAGLFTMMSQQDKYILYL